MDYSYKSTLEMGHRLEQPFTNPLQHPHNLTQILAPWAQSEPDREAMVFLASGAAPQTITYTQLHEDAIIYGSLFVDRGIQPGQLLALVFPHSYQLVAAFFGVLYCGAVPTILPYPRTSKKSAAYLARVQHLVDWAGASAVITTDELDNTLFSGSAIAPEKMLAIPQNRRAFNDTQGFSVHQPQTEDIAYIQFSSGTTGDPRGVEISHRAAMSNINAIAQELPFGENDVNVGWLPFYHDLGLVTQVLVPLRTGGKTVNHSPATWIRNPAILFRAIDEFRGTTSWMPNFAYAHCIRHVRDQYLEGTDLSSLRIFGCGGEHVQQSIMQQFIEQFAPYGLNPTSIMPAYGMAENVAGITHAPQNTGLWVEWVSRTALQKDHIARKVAVNDPAAQVVVSCGLQMNGTEIAIVDAFGNQLSERNVGEIVVRGTSLFSGYFQQPELTAQEMRGGWFHTGDLGYMVGGQLYVVDRIKDLIIVGGRNIYPHFIEETALDVLGKSARRVAAFGVREDTLGTELPVVVCELRRKLDKDEPTRLAAQVRQRVREALDINLADVRFVPRGMVVVTTSGKVARRATREKYLQAGYKPTLQDLWGESALGLRSAQEVEPFLVSLFASVCGQQNLDPQTSFFEQGIDSLALVQIMLVVEERFARAISIQKLVKHPTIAYLAQLLYEDEASMAGKTRETPVLDSADADRQPRDRFIGRLQKRAFIGGPYFRKFTLPYGIGTRLLRAWVQNEFIRNKFFAQETRLIQECLRTVSVAQSPDLVLQQSLMTNLWYRWRVRALTRPGEFQRWVTMRGASVLDEISSSGQGIVLAFPHTRLKRLLHRVPALQTREVCIVGNIRAYELEASGLGELAKTVQRGEGISRTGMRSAQIYRAQQILQRGGVCIILADDIEGKGGVQLPFHGRWRPFRPGAAELAVRTGAVIVPAFATLSIAGRVMFDFLSPLEQVSGDNSAEQIDDLTCQYASVLAERWKTDLGSLEWKILYKHLQFPEM